MENDEQCDSSGECWLEVLLRVEWIQIPVIVLCDWREINIFYSSYYYYSIFAHSLRIYLSGPVSDHTAPQKWEIL